MERTEPLQVVICDDDPVMLQYLRELTEKALASEVFAVRTALAPGELDGQARSAHILILDIQMPEQSGIALAKAVSRENKPDGVILFGVYGEKKDRVVLVRQYRYPLGDYVYEFPAGLVESGEDMAAAGIREMYEETGLIFTPVDAGACSRPFFTTIGMTDESCGTVFGYCSGEPTSAHQESSEDIQVLIADRAECRRILREENVAIMCAYMLMHFIAGEGDPLAFLQKE